MSSSEFCTFIATVDTSSFGFGLEPEAMRSALEQTVEGLRRARDLAPADVAADAETVLDTIAGLVELLDEYDFDLIKISVEAPDDRRFLEFNEQRFTAAVENIGRFCGLDLNTGGASASPPPPSVGGDPPVPDSLVPPGVTEALDVGGGSVVFSSTSAFSDLVEFYTDAMGDPLFINEDEGAALWSATVDGAQATVSLSGDADGGEVLISLL